MRRDCRIVCLLAVLASFYITSVDGDEPATNDITTPRNELMSSKVLAFDVTSTVDGFPGEANLSLQRPRSQLCGSSDLVAGRERTTSCRDYD